jgi:hypothetical protein
MCARRGHSERNTRLESHHAQACPARQCSAWPRCPARVRLRGVRRRQPSALFGSLHEPMNRSSVQARRHSTCMSIPRLRADARVETFTSRSRAKLSSRSRTSRRERGVDCSPGRSRLPRSRRVCAPVQLGNECTAPTTPTRSVLLPLPVGGAPSLRPWHLPHSREPNGTPLESHHPRACRARQRSKERERQLREAAGPTPPTSRREQGSSRHRETGRERKSLTSSEVGW